MATVTDAIFFFREGKVVKEMMMSEFDALLDGVVEMPEFRKQQIHAVYAQIDAQLRIRGLVFFLLGFTASGDVVEEWNLPIQQLMQSAGRGPDLGAGAIRMVCKSQCSVPWHQESLWNPQPQTLQLLVQTAKRNRLGILEEEEEYYLAESWGDIPTLSPVAVPPVLVPPVVPPVITPAINEIPVVSPVMTHYVQPAAMQIPTAIPTAIPVAVAPQMPVQNVNVVDAQLYATLKQEFEAMRAAHAVRIDKLQKERDEFKDKSQSVADTLKEQAKGQIQALHLEFEQELEKKAQQISALKAQIELEKKRYGELKEQLVLQAQRYQTEREELVEQLQQDIDSDKIESLKEAFKKELNARVEAEISKVNEALAMREVELFYRDEQLAIFRDEIKQLKAEKQSVLKENGRQILEALERNGVTLVAYNVGVGHIALPLDDVGRYLDERLLYLADRCGVSPELFALWQEHYYKPLCHHVDHQGEVCNKSIKRTDLAAQFVKGVSDRCPDHQPQTSQQGAAV